MSAAIFRFYFTFLLIAFTGSTFAQESSDIHNAADTDDWTASEYSGSRSAKDSQTAMLSKGFTWLSGSPADNEKLSIGKNAQFFGFVALRYQSGRAANRGVLGRAFFAISNADQRDILADTVAAEHELLQQWWRTRESLLRMYESHLYTNLPIDEQRSSELSLEFSQLGARIGILEARGFAALEDTLTDEQRTQITAWRANPERAREVTEKVRVTSEHLEPEQYKQLEDLFAKAFSWLTGTPADNEIIPLGQPAQFFGFVSIRHKSGHGANRGQIAKSFAAILDREQISEIESAVREQMPVVLEFLRQRKNFLEQLALFRIEPDVFDTERTMELAARMGALEIEAGWIEAKAYRKIRESMTETQIAEMMALRANYVLDESQMASLSDQERGAQLAILCAGCHGAPGENRTNAIGPSLDSVFERPIASTKEFDYSDALRKFGEEHSWTPENLDAFLTSPKAFVPGTKMDFQGLLNPEDRKALIDYLQQVL